MQATRARLQYPVEEAMFLLGIGRTKLYELAKRGDVRMNKIDGRSLITAESIQAYVDRLSGEAQR